MVDFRWLSHGYVMLCQSTIPNTRNTLVHVPCGYHLAEMCWNKLAVGRGTSLVACEHQSS